MLEHSIPLGRAGTPEEAAGAAYLFCIPESDYVSRQTMLCTGGLTGMRPFAQANIHPHDEA